MREDDIRRASFLVPVPVVGEWYEAYGGPSGSYIPVRVKALDAWVVHVQIPDYTRASAPLGDSAIPYTVWPTVIHGKMSDVDTATFKQQYR